MCDLVRAEEGRLAVVEPGQHGASLAGEEAVAEDGRLVGEAGGPLRRVQASQVQQGALSLRGS